MRSCTQFLWVCLLIFDLCAAEVKDARHWAFQPITKPDLPRVKNKAWVRNSVDRFILARMFGQGVFIWGDPIWVPKDADDIELEYLRQTLENSLNDLTKRADAYCGHPKMDPAPLKSEPKTAPIDTVEIQE